MLKRRAVTRALTFFTLGSFEAAKAKGQALAASPASQATPAQALETTIRFSFEILDMVTNHLFDGQTNSFFVTYEYAAPLRGGNFDPAGHSVLNDTFPYFQTVRDDIMDYVRRYSRPSDFYEVFASNIARYVMERYAQFRWVDLTIRAPAFAGVAFDRTVNVRVARG